MKEKYLSSIKVVGLAIGIAAFTVLLEYIFYEKNYDRFHENSSRIYRVTSRYTDSGQTFYKATSPPALGGYLAQNYSQVKNYVTLSTTYGPQKVKIEGNEFLAEYHYASASVGEIFTFEFIEGSVEKFGDPGVAIISSSRANLWFPNKSAIGEQIGTGNEEVTVIAVFKDFPYNSHFHPTFMISMSGWLNRNGTTLQNWKFPSFHTYFLTDNSFDKIYFQNILNEVSEERFLPELEEYIKTVSGANLILQGLEDIHLAQLKNEWEFEQHGDVDHLNTMILIAVLLLVVAVTNFVNISIIQTDVRRKVIGIRKMYGDQGFVHLLLQITEPLVLVFCSFLLAIGLVELAYSNQDTINLVIERYKLSWILRLQFYFLLFIILTFITSIIPILTFSRIRSIDLIFKNRKPQRIMFFSIRNQFVIFQFAVSSFFITGSILMYQQLSYVSNKKLGFNPQHVIIIKNSAGSSDAQLLRNSWRSFSNIIESGTSNSIPGKNVRPENLELKTQKGNVIHKVMKVVIDEGFFPCLSINILQGRNVGPWNRDSTYVDVIVNESFINQFEIDEPIGMVFKSNTYSYGRNLEARIVGVVEDFHYSNLHEKIAPQLFSGQGGTQYVFVKVYEKNIESTLSYLEETYKQVTKTNEFDYNYLDESYSQQYVADQERNRLFIYFAILTVLISSMGLFGISAQYMLIKMKEISTRKIFGASTAELTYKFCIRFCLLALTAFLVSFPLTFIYLNNWIKIFAYRTSLSITTYLFSFVILIVIAVLTVIFNTLKGASTNPSIILRE